MPLKRVETTTGPLFIDADKVRLIGRADIGKSVIMMEGCPPSMVPMDPEALAAAIEGREPPPAVAASKTSPNGLILAN